MYGVKNRVTKGFAEMLSGVLLISSDLYCINCWEGALGSKETPLTGVWNVDSFDSVLWQQKSIAVEFQVAQWWRIRLLMQETQEIWVQSLGCEDPLEKDMATHCRTLAWRIPWTEEPDGLQSMGSQRVRHDWVTPLTYVYVTPKFLIYPSSEPFSFDNHKFVFYVCESVSVL